MKLDFNVQMEFDTIRNRLLVCVCVKNAFTRRLLELIFDLKLILRFSQRVVLARSTEPFIFHRPVDYFVTLLNFSHV